MTMKAFRRYEKAPKAARLEEVDRPTPDDDEVLLKVSHCGLCGSDLHAWLDHPGYEFVLPQVTFGHEVSGVIEDKGGGVSKWNVGDHAVMIAVQTFHDENCRFCREGSPQLSPKRRVQGLSLDGGMAEHVTINEQFLVPIPEGLSLNLAALTEPLSVADHCVTDRSSIGRDSKVIVSGPGVIGALCGIVARHKGAKVLMVGTERDESSRLSRLRQIGFETAIVGPDVSPLDDQAREFFQGEEADAMVEASGAAVALSDAWKSVRPDGEITAVALYGQNVDFNATQFVRKQIDLRTTYASSPRNYQQAIRLLQEDAVDFDALTTVYDLQDASKAFVDAENQAVLKPVLACSD
ncbi:MAG: hypothetical protein CMI31_15710 [Opitutae bacterium]|nr:hypothetical protein [Opitutae bacterium]